MNDRNFFRTKIVRERVHLGPLIWTCQLKRSRSTKFFSQISLKNFYVDTLKA